MRCILAGLLAAGAAAATGMAGTTPMDEKIPDQTPTLIACEVTASTPMKDVRVIKSAKDRKAMVGTYHYNVYLPAGYEADTSKQWPSIFISSPGGNASMGPMSEWLVANGYIAIMLVEAKNGPWLPIAGNFLAAHDDAVKRFRLKEGEKLATGFSGGARAAGLFGAMRPGFRGLILQGAGGSQGDGGGYDFEGIRKIRGFRTAMIVGNSDGNKSEIAGVKACLGGKEKFQSWTFDGGHTWAPAEKFAEAASWVVGKAAN
jgi:hypothetical protein